MSEKNEDSLLNEVSFPEISVTDQTYRSDSLHSSSSVEVDQELGATISQQSGSRHPMAKFFHFFFKVLAVLLYLCFHLFYDNFILVFVACVLALSFDFWTVKNVSGRLLVGLRWWNEIKEDGSNIWVFESKPPNRTVDSGDSMVFWAALYLTPLIWCLLGIMSMFQPKWLLIVVVAIILSGANVVGYWKCQKDAKQKIQNFTTAFIANRL